MANEFDPSQLSAEEFYDRSQDRTRRYLGGEFFESARVALTMSPEIARSYSGQVLALSTANLLSRFCRHAYIAIPDVSLHPYLVRPAATTLLKRIEQEMRGANPFAEYQYGDSFARGADYTLQLGDTEIAGLDADLVADADGWNAFIGHEATSSFSNHSSLNPIGPVAAACLAVADVFKVFTNAPASYRIKGRVFSIFDLSLTDSVQVHPTLPSNLSTGTTQMIGVGSVGSAVVYLLGLLPITGNLTLIDHQDVEYENLDRSPIFMMSDVGRSKVDVARDWLAPGQLLGTPYPVNYSEFIEKYGRGNPSPDLVLLLANEENVYSVLQNNFPPLVLYGTTTAGWGVNLGRHIPLQEECVLCRYPNQGKPSYKCSTTHITTAAQERVDASLPFLSLMAGVLATAELLKAQIDGYPFHGNYAFIDMMGPAETVQVQQRHQRANCICSQQSRAIYEKCIAGSRWASLSHP